MVLTGCLYAEVETSDYITVGKGEVIPHDYFMIAQNVEILGKIDGDAYIAAMQVFIDGEITGDLLLAAGSATIAGNVHGNIRFLGGQAMLSSDTDKNVTVIAGNLQLLPSSNIAGNLVTIAGNVDLSAQIDGTVTAVASNMRVSSNIGKTLDAVSGRLLLTSRAVVGGDLNYRGDEDAIIDSGAVIRGKYTHSPSLLKGFFQGSVLQAFLWGSKFIAFCMNFLFTFAVGVFIIRMYPKNLKYAHEILDTQIWKALGLGVVLLIALPLASILLLMTVLGTPFAMALLAINVLTFYTAKIFSVSWGANYLAKKTHLRASPTLILALGLIIYYALTTIPIGGFIIELTALLLGLGAAVLGRTRRNLLDKLVKTN